MNKFFLAVLIAAVFAGGFSFGFFSSHRQAPKIPILGPVNSTNKSMNTSFESSGSSHQGEVSNATGGSTSPSRPPGAAPGHRISGPLYHTQFEGEPVTWYYDYDTGQYFSDHEAWDPNAGCYHD